MGGGTRCARWVVLLVLISSWTQRLDAFYLPGVAPMDYKKVFSPIDSFDLYLHALRGMLRLLKRFTIAVVV